MLCAYLFASCLQLATDLLLTLSYLLSCPGRAGGHTAEMLTLTAHLDKQRYSPRCYVVAATDRMGEAKANAVEACGREVGMMPG